MWEETIPAQPCEEPFGLMIHLMHSDLKNSLGPTEIQNAQKSLPTLCVGLKLTSIGIRPPFRLIACKQRFHSLSSLYSINLLLYVINSKVGPASERWWDKFGKKQRKEICMHTTTWICWPGWCTCVAWTIRKIILEPIGVCFFLVSKWKKYWR